MEISGLDEHRMILRALPEEADRISPGAIYVNQGAAMSGRRARESSRSSFAPTTCGASA